MYTIITYDIANPRRLARVAKTCSKFAKRVQYSVFEAHLDTDQLANLIGQIERVIVDEEDSVRYYRLCNRCAARPEEIGDGPKPVRRPDDFEVF